jgi:preprotein translocase subunit SecG
VQYTQIYKEQMRRAGFNADRAGDIFDSYYSEYSDDPELEEKVKDARLRLHVMAAAIAHLKTSRYLGIRDRAAYDIRNAWDLTEAEYDFVAETISDDPDTYHLEDSGVPAAELPDDTGAVSTFDLDDPLAEEKVDVAEVSVNTKGIRRAAIIMFVLFLVFLIVFSGSIYLYMQDPGYDLVTVKVKSVITDYDRYSNLRYGDNSDTNESDRSDHLVVVEVAGSYEQLNGVPSEEVSHLYSIAAGIGNSIRVYRYNGKYYYSQKSVADSRMCARVMQYSTILLRAFGVAFIILLSLYIRDRKRSRSVS